MIKKINIAAKIGANSNTTISLRCWLLHFTKNKKIQCEQTRNCNQVEEQNKVVKAS